MAAPHVEPRIEPGVVERDVEPAKRPHATEATVTPTPQREGTPNRLITQADPVCRLRKLIDPSADLKIKGVFTHCTYGIGSVTAWGDYRPQGPSDLEGGEFKVTGVDNGEPGIGEDWVKIKLWESGFYYWNAGDLMGGNIQEH